MVAHRSRWLAGVLLFGLMTACSDDNPTEPENTAAPPAAPTDLTATALSSASVRLAWTDNASNEQGYALHRCTGDVWACADSVAAGIHVWDDAGLQAATTYAYTVVAFNDHGTTACTDTVEVTTLPPGEAPGAPRMIAPSDGAAGLGVNVDLVWSCDDPDGDDLTYDLYLADHPYPNLHASNLTQETFFAQGLEFDADHHWYVVAKDGTGYETTGPTWTFATRASPLVAAGACEYGFMGAWAIDAVVVNNHLYVAHAGRGLDVFSLADPVAPQLIGNHAVGTERAAGVCVDGTIAYVAYGWAGVRTIDVGIPSAPVELGSCLDSGIYGSAVAKAGDVLYVARWDAGVVYVDVSDPTQPDSLGVVAIPGDASDVIVDGATLYVSGDVLTVLDVSTPASPTPLGELTASTAIGDLALEGDRLYAVGGPGLLIIDVANPAAPSLLGDYEGGFGGVGRPTVAGDLLAYCDMSSVQLLDVSSPIRPLLVGEYSESFATFPLAAGGYYYLFLDQRLRVLRYAP